DEDEELANAFADLAVTGRRTYCLLATPPRTPLDELALSGAGEHVDLGTTPYTPSELRDEIAGLLAPLVQATPAQSTRAIDAALDRAFRTLWALRGPVVERTATRAALGWIAVSGEDDMPHRLHTRCASCHRTPGRWSPKVTTSSCFCTVMSRAPRRRSRSFRTSTWPV